MEEIKYIGEQTWAGQFGHALLLLSFVTALLSSFSFFRAERNPTDPAWKKLGRISFLAHAVSVLLAIGLIFFMLTQHYFEYQYVWQHSSLDMPLNFIFACFWEGQEGSFLLWMFWHVVIGFILLRKAGNWEAPVMSVFMLVQIFLTSMVIGSYFFDYKWGSSPFLLVREQPENLGLPWVSMEDYKTLPMFIDGRGLNPLLQNYWMTIHPPTLFLGFALTLVPFCYVIAALWRKDMRSWIQQALPWTYTGIMILGTGILMGGAWAYEALSFGGFWAWDPVENASLVPWITLVAGAHVMLIMKSRNIYNGLGIFLNIIPFILVLYSTFLTRSGILGDASVHSFTDLGMYWQLVLFLGTFFLLGIVLLIVRRKYLKGDPQPEEITSREFWMLIGMLALLLSAFHICFTTSFPVFNKLFGSTFALLEPADYNKWQAFFAILIGILMAISQFFKYRKTETAELKKKLLRPLIISMVLAIGIGFWTKWISTDPHILWLFLLFSTLFIIVGNTDFWLSVLKGKFDKAGPSVAHAGFGILLLGALISTGKSSVISKSEKGSFNWLGPEFSSGENVMIRRNEAILMGDYTAVYRGKKLEGTKVDFEVDYYSDNHSIEPDFTLHPYIQLNERMGNSAEPDTRHFFHKDIYTHVMYAELGTLKDTTAPGNYMAPNNQSVHPGDTIAGYNFYMIFEGFDTKVDTVLHGIKGADLVVGARIKLVDFMMKDTLITPIYYIVNDEAKVIESVVPHLGLKVVMWKIDPTDGKVEISYVRKKQESDDFIVLKAVEFPAINLLWTGCLIMVAGTFMSVRKRWRKKGADQ